MRVGFESGPRGASEPTGVERAQATLLAALAKLPGLELFTLRPGPGPVALWRETRLPALVRELRLDAFHSPVAAVPLRAGCPVLATLHDLPWAVPGTGLRAPAGGSGAAAAALAGERRLAERARVALAVRVAARLVCVSGRTQAQLCALHPAAAARARIVPHGVDPLFTPRPPGGEPAAGSAPPPDGAGPGIGAPYVLAVGRLRRRKNLRTLMDAFVLARGAAGMRLVLAGPAGDADAALRTRAAAADLRGRVVFTGHVDDDRLLALYRGARCTAQVSMLEGFGLPVLESMACGVPAVAARQGAVPEVAEGAAEPCDGGDVRDVARALDAVLLDGERAAALREAGLRRARQLGAERAARAMAAVYAELAR